MKKKYDEPILSIVELEVKDICFGSIEKATPNYEGDFGFDPGNPWNYGGRK